MRRLLTQFSRLQVSKYVLPHQKTLPKSIRCLIQVSYRGILHSFESPPSIRRFSSAGLSKILTRAVVAGSRCELIQDPALLGFAGLEVPGSHSTEQFAFALVCH